MIGDAIAQAKAPTCALPQADGIGPSLHSSREDTSMLTLGLSWITKSRLLAIQTLSVFWGDFKKEPRQAQIKAKK